MIRLEADAATEVVIGPFVDETDAVTPITGIINWDSTTSVNLIKESGAQGGVSVTALEGGTNMDPGGAGDYEIQEINDGYYRMKLPASAVDTEGRLRLTFRDDDRYLPMTFEAEVVAANVYQAMVKATASLTDLATIKNRLGGWAGSGINTVLGAFQALFRKSGISAPTDIGGTFNPTTDSVEALRDRLEEGLGSGFATASNSLVALTTAISAVGTAGSSSGGGGTGSPTTSTARAGGFLARMFRIIRKAVDQPNINAKYGDSDLLDLLEQNCHEFWTELRMVAQDAAMVRMDLAVVVDRQEYFLPPTVGEITRLHLVDATTDLSMGDAIPLGRYNPSGVGWSVEGNVLRLGRKPKAAETLRLEYVPSGDIRPHEGVGDVQSGGLTFLMDPTGLLTGTLDTRPNAYAGYVLRTFGDDDPQTVVERTVRASSKYMLTVAPIMTLPSGRNYELVPCFWRHVEVALGLKASLRILSQEGDSKRYGMIEKEYAKSMRTARLSHLNRQSRRASHMEGDTPDNTRYGPRMPFGIRG
jgi:hypothetical protein